jgi:hypothetical protein
MAIMYGVGSAAADAEAITAKNEDTTRILNNIV